MITIHLHNLLFHSYHGIHEEEKVLGNDYEVNADVTFHEEVLEITSIRQTIDYIELYEIIRQRMTIATPLLETIVTDIGNCLREKYDNLRSINIRLTKLNPPIENFRGSVGVTLQKVF
jgi:dihydroneopterin aldolase